MEKREVKEISNVKNDTSFKTISLKCEQCGANLEFRQSTTEGLLFVESLINGPYSPAPFPKGARERLFANSESGKCQLFSHLTSHTAIAPSALDRRRLNSYTNLSNAIV